MDAMLCDGWRGPAHVLLVGVLACVALRSRLASRPCDDSRRSTLGAAVAALT